MVIWHIFFIKNRDLLKQRILFWLCQMAGSMAYQIPLQGITILLKHLWINFFFALRCQFPMCEAVRSDQIQLSHNSYCWGILSNCVLHCSIPAKIVYNLLWLETSTKIHEEDALAHNRRALAFLLLASRRNRRNYVRRSTNYPMLVRNQSIVRFQWIYK